MNESQKSRHRFHAGKYTHFFTWLLLSLIAVHGCRCDLDPIDRIPEAAATTNQNIIDFGEILVGLRVSASFGNTGIRRETFAFC